ncbi:hypothetical protein [Mucilaginibacter celer]|uniref:Uncharacterized protein n=1 Tax=Mucilaginibacter celer TaxID=2305508 RepID=A0A494VTC4_9SPHI|nr:hypothetical protein [Mucilaginibacter celer]AYL94605.1 hypothetical protein HYN43_004515 [Mucilaginibacter celer]
MNIELTVNQTGDLFFEKWQKDTSISIFVLGPAFLIFFSVCTMMMVGVTWNCVYILTPPILITIGAFYYSPLVLRKKYINNTVQSLSIDDDILNLKTFKLFGNKPIIVSLDIRTVKAEEINERFFGDKKIVLLKHTSSEMQGFYLVDELFDSPKRFAELFESLNKG